MRHMILAASLILAPDAARAAVVDLSTPVLAASGQQLTDCAEMSDPQPKVFPICKKTVKVDVGYVLASVLDRVEPGMRASDIVAHGKLAIEIRDSDRVRIKPQTIEIDQATIDWITGELPKMNMTASEIAQVAGALSSKK
jgi:hypothetical protein